ncbi:cupin domain-containing protein [Psychrobacillus sp. OK032]|uniref:cupin domain-containing protein n=1 Tax=Psychrobacillus sp. OK032 TaxID=1884358 RepID=UPI0011601889
MIASVTQERNFITSCKGEVFNLNEDHHHVLSGDIVHFPSELLHAWENPTSEETVILSVTTPIIF